jgi:L-rhamnose mutarotase
MTIIELQNQIQQKALELPPDLLQEVFDYMEFVVEKKRRRLFSSDQELQKWWENLDDFSNDFMKDRTQPPLDTLETLFE